MSAHRASQHFTLDAEGDRTVLDETALVQANPAALATDHYGMSYSFADNVITEDP